MRIEILLIGISVILPLASEKPFKNVNIQMSEIRFQLGDIGQRTKEELLEWELSNGNVSSMELMEKVLSGRSLDAHLFDEYVQMDISNGIEELNELADEWKRAKELNVKEEDRKKILDALDGLKVINSSSLTTELEEKIRDFIEKNRYNGISSEIFQTLEDHLFPALKQIRIIVQQFPKENYATQDQIDRISFTEYDEIILRAQKVSSHFGEMVKDFKYKLEGFSSTEIDPRKYFEEAIRFIEVAENQAKNVDISILKGLENEMKPIEELRDKTIGEVKNLTEKLEDTVSKMKGVGTQEEVLEEYKSIESASKFLQKVENFFYSVNRVVRQFQTMKKRWSPTINHLDQLQIPPGSLSEHLKKLQVCPSFPMYYRNRISDNFLKQLNEILDLHSILKVFVEKLKGHNYPELLEKFSNAVHPGYRKMAIILQTFYDFNPAIFDNIRGDVEPIEKGLRTTKTEVLVRKYNILRNQMNTDLEEIVKYFGYDFWEAEEHLKCLLGLVSEAKPLIELPPKVWDFDLRTTRHLVETVLGFKRIHRMMVELNEWKFEKKMESFGLNEKDVNAIQEGIEVVEQLRDIDGLLKEMNELSGINGSEVEEAWQTVRTALIQLNSELSDHLPPIDTNLTHLRSAISVIQLPSDLPIQLIIDWVNENLKGVVRSEYENTLQRLIHLDFENYSKKLDEMSHAIDKWSGNKGSAKEEEKEEEDCLVVRAWFFFEEISEFQNNTCTTTQSFLITSNILYAIIPLYFLFISAFTITKCPGNQILPFWLALLALLIIIDRVFFWKILANEVSFEKTYPMPGDIDQLKKWEKDRNKSSSKVMIYLKTNLRIVFFLA
uniref:WSN domain-containing protein n=1 Tax=Caenorhabditis tropicalis TaxID=1561998 RepID=A0A1I7UU53_9PELO